MPENLQPQTGPAPSYRKRVAYLALACATIAALAVAIVLWPPNVRDGGCTSGGIADRAAALGFAENAPYGSAFDSEDGSGAFNACLEDVTFGYDGQDLWVHVDKAGVPTVHIRGTFEGEYLVRPGATTLQRLDFLDAKLSISALRKSVADDIAATRGTPGDDVLPGRAGKDDFLEAGLGSDTYIIGPHSGSDTIRLEGNAPGDHDTIRLDFKMDHVFEREPPEANVWKEDQAIEFLEVRRNGADIDALYLLPQRVIVDGMYPGRASRKDKPNVDFVFLDSSERSQSVPRLEVVEFPFLRAEAQIGRLRTGDDLQLLVGDRLYLVERQFATEDDDGQGQGADLIFFSDGEVVTRAMLEGLSNAVARMGAKERP